MSRRRMIHSQGSGYVICKYLESNGKQYIDSGYLFNGNETIICSASIDVSVYNNAYYGSDTAAFAAIQGYKNIQALFPGDIRVNFKDATYRNTLIVDYLNKYYSKDSGETKTYFDRVFQQSKESMLILNSRANGFINKPTNIAKAKIFSFEIIKNGISIMKLCPAVDNNNKPCMYDIVTKKLLYNQGDGEFGYEIMDGTYVSPI